MKKLLTFILLISAAIAVQARAGQIDTTDFEVKPKRTVRTYGGWASTAVPYSFLGTAQAAESQFQDPIDYTRQYGPDEGRATDDPAD